MGQRVCAAYCLLLEGWRINGLLWASNNQGSIWSEFVIWFLQNLSGLLVFKEFICVCVSVWVYATCTWYPQRQEEGIKFPGAGVVNVYCHQHGCWEYNLGPVEVLLPTESSLQHQLLNFSNPLFLCFLSYHLLFSSNFMVHWLTLSELSGRPHFKLDLCCSVWSDCLPF